MTCRFDPSIKLHTLQSFILLYIKSIVKCRCRSTMLAKSKPHSVPAWRSCGNGISFETADGQKLHRRPIIGPIGDSPMIARPLLLAIALSGSIAATGAAQAAPVASAQTAKAEGVAHAPLRPRATRTCGRGGIGRHAGFKIQFRKECGFDSHRPHHRVEGRHTRSSIRALLDVSLLLEMSRNRSRRAG